MCDCFIAICSPARPPPVMDLRTIMDMEANSVQPLGATPKSPGRYEARGDDLQTTRSACLLPRRMTDQYFFIVVHFIFFHLPAVSAPSASTPLFPLNCPRSRGRCWPWLARRPLRSPQHPNPPPSSPHPKAAVGRPGELVRARRQPTELIMK